MKLIQRALFTVIGLVLLSSQAFAFVAQHIQIEGLQRINRNTVLSYMPVKAGANITPEVSNKIIADLYKTNFFSNITLDRQGSTLIVKVQERPIISSISLHGNQVVSSKALLKVLKNLGIADGYEYRQSVFNKIKTALLNEYYSHGKYNARVDIVTTKGKNNSVAVSINISEGLTATIKQIKIIGNHAFSESTLLDQFKLSTPGLFSFFTHDDQYSGAKLEADLQSLQAYYLDRGYLHFRILSSHVSLSPNRNHVYLLIKIQEGGQYKFSGFKLTGHLILPRKQLRNLVTIKPNTIFSKSEVVNAETAIGDALGSKGYAKAKVTTKPQVNEKTKRVFLVFDVQPGPHVYVRFINFQGNNSTNDEAFRRVLTQMEGGLVSTTALKNSKQRLLQLPFVRNVELTTTPVRGKPNEEDLNYKVTTVPAGKIQAGVGYSDVDGAMINAGISQQNIFGTGNSFNISTSYSASMLSAQVGYFNPYYTQWGVGRGFNIYASHYDASEANIADYATDNYGGAVTYSIPMTLHTSVQFSLGLDDLYLQPASDPSEEIDSFVTKHGKSFLQIPVNFGVTYNDLNRTVFPTAGFVQTGGVAVSVPVDSKSLEYYKLTYNAQYYQPIYKSFIAHFKVGGGYGGGYGDYDKLPFFKNFYAGGMGTVRGYAANTIGPQDSQGNSIGGNLLYYASAGLVFPNPFSKTLRTTWFFDAGNVINTKATRAERARNPDRNAVRMSTGVEFDWLSPMGMLNFSLAKALNANSQDDTQVFQFNIGTVF